MAIRYERIPHYTAYIPRFLRRADRTGMRLIDVITALMSLTFTLFLCSFVGYNVIVFVLVGAPLLYLTIGLSTLLIPTYRKGAQ
jgi:hypothetical protein